MKIKFKKEVQPELNETKKVRKFLLLPIFAADNDNYYIFWLEYATILKEYYGCHGWRNVAINGLTIDNAWNRIVIQKAVLWQK